MVYYQETPFPPAVYRIDTMSADRPVIWDANDPGWPEYQQWIADPANVVRPMPTPFPAIATQDWVNAQIAEAISNIGT